MEHGSISSTGRPIVKISGKKKDTLVLLSALFGSLGVDRFYRGQAGLGIVKLLTLGGCGLWALIDTIMYLVSDLPRDSNGNIIVDSKTVALIKANIQLVDEYGNPIGS